jgi:hypothetical protein
MAGQLKNIFYAAANILIDLETGKTTQVMMLANSQDEATLFNETEVRDYLSFIERRVPNIKWSPIPSHRQPSMFVIRGEQTVAIR